MAADNFNRANESPIASPWAAWGSLNTCRLVSNAVQNVTADSDSGALYTSSSVASSQLDYVSGTTDGGPAIECSQTDSDGEFETSYDATKYYIFRLDNGSFTELGNTVGTYTAGQPNRLRRSGNDIIASKNGTDVLTVTDTTYSGTGHPGFFAYAGDLIQDNWQDGVSAGQDVSPTAIASAAVFGSHTVTVGQSLAPTAIPTAAVFGSHTVVKMSFILPVAIASAAAFGSHTIVKDVDSSGIPSAAEYGSHTVVDDGQTIAPTGIASAATFGSHTVAHADQTLLPTAIGTAAVFGAHTVADVVLTVEPVAVASAAEYGSHLVNMAGTQVLSPEAVASAVVLGAHTVANVAAQSLAPVAVVSAVEYGSHTIGLVLETIIVTGISSAAVFGRPTILGGVAPSEFYIGSSSVTIDDRVEEDREIGEANVQKPLGDLP